MAQDVDHQAVGVADEEPAHPPILVLQGMDDLAPLPRTASYTASTSSTSTLMSGVTGAVLSPVVKLICATGVDGEAIVMIHPWFMTSSNPSRP
ncbi:hypothetical protein SF23_05185 [Streptomyces sp. MBRL 10]|nr:hypothetical protein SF23_05185 [Streptomyces sp. MBRL 10]